MGLIDFLFGTKQDSKVETIQDRVWISEEAKFNGIPNELKKPTDSRAILLIAHFDETFDQLNFAIKNDKHDVPVSVMLAEKLTSNFVYEWNLHDTDRIELIVAEHHPLLSADDKLIQFAEELEYRCRVTYHISLEDPLIEQAQSEWVKKWLTEAGLAESHYVESELITRTVSRQISKRQKKVRSQAIGNTRCSSARQWLEKNMPHP